MVKLGLILSILLVLTGCLPQAKQQSCGQGNVFNSTTRSCVPVTSGGQTSGVSIAGRNPSVSNFSVTSNSLAALNFSVSINNPLNQGYNLNWKLYSPTGSVTQLTSLISGAVSFVPNSVFSGSSTGVWTLAAEVVSTPGNILVTQTQWFISVITTPTPTLAKTSTPQLSISNNPLPTLFSVNVSNPGNMASLAVVWYYNGVQDSIVSMTSAGTFPNSRVLFNAAYPSLSSDKPPLMTGPATVRVEVRQGSAFGQLYDYVEWPLFVNPPIFPTISPTLLPALGTALSAVNNLPSSLKINGTTPLTLANSFCLTVSSGLGSTNQSGSVIVEYFKNASMPFAVQVVPNPGGQVCLGSTPSNFTNLSFSLNNPSMGEIQSISARVKDNGTTIATLTWPVSVMPVNTPPTVSIVSPAVTGVTPVSHKAGTAQTYTVSVQDNEHPDDSTAQHTYFWRYGGVLLNGVNNFPGTSVKTPACTGTGPAFKSCPITIPSYNLSGREQHLVSTVNLSAQLEVIVQDPGGPAGVTAAPLNSSPAFWTLRRIETNIPPVANAPTIAPLGVNTCTPVVDPASVPIPLVPATAEACVAGNSFIALASSPNTPITPVAGAIPALTEGQQIVFNILVTDTDRDNFNITINCISASGVPCDAPLVHNSTVTRTNDSFGRRVIVPYTISQLSLVGVLSGSITYRVSVSDNLSFFNGVSQTPVTTGVTALQADFVVTALANTNPPPTFTLGQQTPAVGTTSDVLVGAPFTIDPGAITDASTSDGVNIQYQWEVRVAAGTWRAIPGATQRILKWTPHINSVDDLLEIRLCLGDDGVGNSVSTCVTNLGVWNINPRINRLASISNGTVGDSATWTLKDSSRQEFYSAFATALGNIIIEKYRFTNDGDLEVVSTLQFKAEKDSVAAVEVSRLSLKGHSTTVSGKTFRGLYLSYVTKVVGDPPTNSKMRVRYIDITDPEDLIFSYSGIYWSGCVDATTKAYDANCINNGNGTAPYTVAATPLGSRDITLTVTGDIPAGSQIAINGVKLTSVAAGTYNNFAAGLGWSSGVNSPCEFTGSVVGNNFQLAEIIAGAYNACMGNQLTELRFNQGGALYTALTANVLFSAMPAMAIDIDFPIAFGRVGDLIVSDNVLAVPYLDNNQNGKLALAVIRLREADHLHYRGIASRENTDMTAVTTYRPLVVTADSLDLANSNAQAGEFDVALVTTFNRINYHRFTITPTATSASFTLNAASSKLNVFNTVAAVEKPRIASGLPATNNNVFILAQDVTGDRELQFARIAPASWNMETFSPLDQNNVQAKNLRDYRLSPDNCGSNNNGVMLAAYTNSNLSLISTIRTPSPANTGLFMYPEYFQDPNLTNGFDYPALSAGNVTPTIAIGPSFNLENVGDAGAVVNENNTCAMAIAHAGTTKGETSVINIKPTAINATEVQNNPTVQGLFQPPYIK